MAGRFEFVKLDEYQADAIKRIRASYEEVAAKIQKRGYPQNEKYLELALDRLEESCMYAVKSISHNRSK